jgi:hypothetical protein
MLLSYWHYLLLWVTLGLCGDQGALFSKKGAKMGFFKAADFSQDLTSFAHSTDPCSADGGVSMSAVPAPAVAENQANRLQNERGTATA